MISVSINGVLLRVKKGTTILEAATQAHIFIPRLCGHPDIPPIGKCGLCLVQINGKVEELACMTKIRSEILVDTNAPLVKDKAYKTLHNNAYKLLKPITPEIEEVFTYFIERPQLKEKKVIHTHSVVFNFSLCINCGCCFRECNDFQKISALSETNHTVNKSNCIRCGQCIAICPTGALSENSSVPRVLRAISKGKTMALQVAPSVRTSVGELFGESVGSVCTRKIVGAAKLMGFKYVFDTIFGAEMTIIEEGTELISRLNSQENLPMFTSCCPAWVNFVERFHPELIPNLCTAKSPMEMLGKMVKTYFVEKMNLKVEDVFHVALMPCTAKKDEIERAQLKGAVDAVLTAREFAKLFNVYEISWNELAGENFDPLLSESTGGATLFGITGGVTESSIRYVHEKITGEKLGTVKYVQWRGFKKIKTATIALGPNNVKIAVCNGITAAREFIESGDYQNFHFIEVMSCFCGCIGGGGQPKTKRISEIRLRANPIYEIDMEMTDKQTSNDNEEVKQLYSEYIGEAGGEKALQILHTSFAQIQAE